MQLVEKKNLFQIKMMLKIAVYLAAFLSTTTATNDACTDVVCTDTISDSVCQLTSTGSPGYECVCATDFQNVGNKCVACPDNKAGVNCGQCAAKFYGDACDYTYSAEKKLNLEIFYEQPWNDVYSDTDSNDYTNLVTTLKTEIKNLLSSAKLFAVKEDSIKIISVRSSAPARRRRDNSPNGNAAGAADPKIIVKYEFVAKYDGAKVTNAALKKAVADQFVLPEGGKVLINGAGQLSASLMMAFVTLMMVF